MARAAVDVLIDDEGTADSTADIHIKDRRITDARTQAGFRQPGRIGVVLEDNHGYFELVANPLSKWKVIPTFYLERRLRTTRRGIDGTAEANAGGFDFPSAQLGLCEQRRKGRLDLIPDAGGTPRRLDDEPFQGQNASAPLAYSELELGATDLNAEHPRFSH